MTNRRTPSRSILLLILLAWASPLSAHGPVKPQPVEWIPGQLLVKVRAGGSDACPANRP